jgi:cytochrome c-type biogenesis protein CcmH/NrfG
VWALLLVLALALAGQTVRLRDRLRANRILREVEILTLAAASRGQAPPALFAHNFDQLRQAAALDPSQVAVPNTRGGLYLLLGNGAAAAESYRSALQLEPRPEVYLNLGRALAHSGQIEGPEGARQQFRLALRLDPRLLPAIPPELR